MTDWRPTPGRLAHPNIPPPAAAAAAAAAASGDRPFFSLCRAMDEQFKQDMLKHIGLLHTNVAALHSSVEDIKLTLEWPSSVTPPCSGAHSQLWRMAVACRLPTAVTVHPVGVGTTGAP